jgi:hypothetical protein
MPPLEAMQVEVERRMLRGDRFSDVEDLINDSALSGDEKSALWLLGWSYLDRRAQRREARAHIQQIRARDSAPPVTRRWQLRAV